MDGVFPCVRRTAPKAACLAALALVVCLAGCHVPKGYLLRGDWSLEFNRVPWVEGSCESHGCATGHCGPDSAPLVGQKPAIKDSLGSAPATAFRSRLQPVPTQSGLPQFGPAQAPPVDGVRAMAPEPAGPAIQRSSMQRSSMQRQVPVRPSSWIFAPAEAHQARMQLAATTAPRQPPHDPRTSARQPARPQTPTVTAAAEFEPAQTRAVPVAADARATAIGAMPESATPDNASVAVEPASPSSDASTTSSLAAGNELTLRPAAVAATTTNVDSAAVSQAAVAPPEIGQSAVADSAGSDSVRGVPEPAQRPLPEWRPVRPRR